MLGTCQYSLYSQVYKCNQQINNITCSCIPASSPSIQLCVLSTGMIRTFIQRIDSFGCSLSDLNMLNDKK